MVLLVAALVVGVGGWLVPARWKTLHPAVLLAAGRGTPAVAEVAKAAVAREQFGYAARLAVAADMNEMAAEAINAATARGVAVTGGVDPTLRGVLVSTGAGGPSAGINSILDILVLETNRVALRKRLLESRSPGALSIVATREMPVRQFIPVGKPGGQPLEAVILLTALLYEGERFTPAMAQHLKALSDQARSAEGSDALEEFYLHLLVVARRLDWVSLSELLRVTPDLAALRQFSQAVKAVPDHFGVLYAAAVLGKSPSTVGEMAMRGEPGLRAIAYALRQGQGAVEWLMVHPKNLDPGGPSIEAAALAVARAPTGMLAARWGLFLLTGLLATFGIAAWFPTPAPTTAGDREGVGGPSMRHLPIGFAAGVIALTLVLLSEPGLTHPIRPPAYELHLDTAVLTKAGSVAQTSPNRKALMDWSTIASIAFFATLQIGVYLACLRKIREIESLPEDPLVKLRLMENEENLFDAGLYVGIGGTATALVLQVLGIIEANLLAAYSSNLMGIIGVALVKIRHVRPYKRMLILEGNN